MNQTIKTFLPLFLVLIVDAMGFGIIFPVVGPLFMDPHSALLPAGSSEHLRSLCYGLTMIVFFGSLLLGAPFFGDLSDRLGRKKVITICLIITGISYLLCAIGIIGHSLILFLFARILGGFTSGSEAIAQAALIDVSPAEKKTINLSLMTLAGCIGFIIGPMIGGIFSDKSLAHWFGYTTPFILAGILSLVNAIALWLAFKETHEQKPTTKLQLFRGVAIFVEAFTNGKVERLSLIFLLMQLSWAVYFQIINLLFVTVYQYTPRQLGYFNGYLGVIFSITMVYIIRLFLKWMKERDLALFSIILMSASMLANAFFPQLWAPWVFVITVTLGVGMSYACLLSLFSSSVSEEHQGWVMGVSGAVMAVSWSLGGIITSMLPLKSLSLPLILAGLIGVLSMLFLLNYRKKIGGIYNDPKK